MLNHWNFKTAAAIASATILIACSSDKASDPNAPLIAMTGCVGTGAGTDQYVLTGIKLAPPAEQPSNPASTAGTGITEYSQVRLAMADRAQIEKLVGKTASVVGTIKDDGRNTIGTSGPAVGAGESEPRTDQSQAATSQHHSDKVKKEAGPIAQRSMNNGTLPEIAVQRIDATGQPCETSPSPDRR